MKIFFISLIIVLSFNITHANQTIEQFGNEYFTEVCKRFIACSNDPGVAEMASMARIKDVKSCVTAMTRRDNPQKWSAVLDLKRVTFDSKTKAACFAGIAKMSCKSMAFGVRKPAEINGCESVITGVVADFESCKTHLECKSSDASCSGGKCEKPRPLLCGDEECTANQTCDFNAQRCISPKQVGQSCTNFSECETSSCVDGKCMKGAVVAKPGGSCEINICPLGEECDGKTCKAY
jgi:hypothetical protein